MGRFHVRYSEVVLTKKILKAYTVHALTLLASFTVYIVYLGFSTVVISYLQMDCFRFLLLLLLSIEMALCLFVIPEGKPEQIGLGTS